MPQPQPFFDPLQPTKATIEPAISKKYINVFIFFIDLILS